MEGRPWGGGKPVIVGPIRPRPGILALSLPPGRWTPPTAQQHDFMLWVVSGALLRARGRVPDLVLERDVSEVDRSRDERWRVISTAPAIVAVLTSGTFAELTAVPDVTHDLLRAMRSQHERNLELRAIVGIYDVEERILSFFVHLARHIGLPEGGAVRIPIALEQRRVEEILGAGHTQATTAFRSLVRAGVLVHDAAGWLVACSVPNTSEAVSCSAPNPISSGGDSPLPFVTPAA